MRVKFNPLALLLDASLEGEYDLVQRVIYEVSLSIPQAPPGHDLSGFDPLPAALCFLFHWVWLVLQHLILIFYDMYTRNKCKGSRKRMYLSCANHQSIFTCFYGEYNFAGPNSRWYWLSPEIMQVFSQVEDPSMPNDEGITALHNAVCAGHMEIVKFLVQFGVNANAADSDGW